jgi:hypothetical protein
MKQSYDAAGRFERRRNVDKIGIERVAHHLIVSARSLTRGNLLVDVVGNSS